MATKTKKPGKRELRAQVAAERAERLRHLQDLLRALALGPGVAAELETLAAGSREADAQKLLSQHAGKTEGDTRRIQEAWDVAQALAKLPKI